MMFPFKAGLVTLALVSLALSAAAAEPLTEISPTKPCVGVLTEDPTGDQRTGPLLNGPVQQTQTEAGDHMDITRVFFTSHRTTIKTGESVRILTANIEVADLEAVVPARGTTSYYVDFADFPETPGSPQSTNTRAYRRFRATVNREGELSYWVDSTSQARPNAIESTGRFLPGKEGEKGLIQIDSVDWISGPPQDFWSRAEAAGGLKNVFAYSRVDETNLDAPGGISDMAPDAGAEAGLTFALAECPQPEATATATATSVPTATATPTPAAATTPPGPPPASPAQSVAPSLGDVTDAKPKKTARKPACVKKAKKIKNRRARTKALKRCKKAKGHTR
jgi:hypothetical protein